MGAVPSTPRRTNSRPQDTVEYLIGTFVGDESFPISSDFWQKLIELPLSLQWPTDSVQQACELLATNNYKTRHLSKILIHMAWCLQECITNSGASSLTYEKAINVVYVSSVFLKHLIENAKSDRIEELCLSLNDTESASKEFIGDQNVEVFVMHSVLSFIGSVNVSDEKYLLHVELLNFMLIAMSTQLLSGPSPRPKDFNPFIDAAMAQDSALVIVVMRKLLLNFISRPNLPLHSSYPIFYDANQSGVFQRVSSAAANFVLMPFNYLVSSTSQGSESPLADCSLNVLLILIHYRKCIVSNESLASGDNVSLDSLLKENATFYDNPYCKALESASDVEFDRVDSDGNAHNGPFVRLPFALLFDTLGMCLADEGSVLLLYSLLQGNSDFLEYVLVRTDLDTLLMPILEALYNASTRSSNQIYMLLIILLILSQDSSFNASIHKLILPTVPWYKERLLHQTSLGSLVVIILIRTVQFNLSKLRDVYLHTTCLATLANMAPHVHRLSSYASQRLVSLFDMLSRKYNRSAELKNIKVDNAKTDFTEINFPADDAPTEIHIYTDFLRLVLEILNATLSYALPRNPEFIYAIMHRQEVFQPFKNHPRFNELLENIYTVLDFFNSRIDAQRMDGDWSVEKVLQVIINNCRSWRGEGLKMFTQLRFTYEQESHPEEFFIPYVWQLVLSTCGFNFNAGVINLFPANLPSEKEVDEDTTVDDKQPDGEAQKLAIYIDP
ncbi:dymeclin-like [Cucurbita moschata]|uniref:Dymeclin n=1 Tax=Cucurbita moschata TaxID=3662 RepID=A0A6J1GX92_CUCMO|nr:dymeclin-like [Cucurbita moschata]